jgi:amino acid adenylation domain-containing protein
MIALIQHSIAEQARQRPGHAAFRCRGDSLTYQQLFHRSNQLAHALRELGLKPMERVGILMGKQIELPVATYGILAAGGCYVPIDPNATPSRIEFILRDCNIQILLTSGPRLKLVERIAAAGSTPLRYAIGLPEATAGLRRTLPWSALETYPSSPPACESVEDDLAYIMYTSGSTGVPKGLMHTHRSGLAYARYSAALYKVGPDDVLGNHASLHFDISTFEFLTGPYVGATSVLIPEEEIMFAANLPRFIEHERLTFWYSVPLALVHLLTRGDLTGVDLSSLRWVLFGGEPFPPKYLHALMQHIPRARFCNVYGPAEVNQCTYYHVPSDFPQTGEPVPLGAAWPGAHLILVDDQDRPVEPGEAGQLLVASATCMQGYWARPDLNGKAFFIDEPLPGFHRRYYRTGDLARLDSKGLLHFLGRQDRQIKIRGYRLELDEVEAAFAAQASIEEAAAIAAPRGDGEKQICVFVLPRHAATFDPAEALSQARATLPSYAVPGRLEIVTAFPRTATGKIDRSKLSPLHEDVCPA